MSLNVINPFQKFASGGNIGIYTELGRSITTGTTDTITIASLANKPYLMVICQGINSGQINPSLRFNGSTSGVTIPHNLGGTPEWIILKDLNDANKAAFLVKELEDVAKDESRLFRQTAFSQFIGLEDNGGSIINGIIGEPGYRPKNSVKNLKKSIFCRNGNFLTVFSQIIPNYEFSHGYY